MWPRARPAALPSTSAPTGWRLTASPSPSWIRRATRPLPPCAPAAPWLPTSPFWWWLQTTASCPKPLRLSTTPRQPRFPSSWPSTKWISRGQTPIKSCSSSQNMSWWPRSGAATRLSARFPPRPAWASRTCWRWWPSPPKCVSCGQIPSALPGARSSRPGWTRAAAPWPPCWCRTAPCVRAM
ncbi:hypothetical protein SDC9_155256 [bioreactor metagenome]|uniref:Uncharacterized protein n=1 Tax=bioreactor metagenome TaxID=1076179 RepID=A0A645F2E0_9ZZZZ